MGPVRRQTGLRRLWILSYACLRRAGVPRCARSQPSTPAYSGLVLSPSLDHTQGFYWPLGNWTVKRSPTPTKATVTQVARVLVILDRALDLPPSLYIVRWVRET